MVVDGGGAMLAETKSYPTQSFSFCGGASAISVRRYDLVILVNPRWG